METSKSKWQDKRAIIVVRQSSDKDGTASTAAQLDYMLKDLVRVGMVYADKVVLEGVVGSSAARITEELEALFARKKKANDFEVIAWQLEDRASRGGGEFGMWIEHEAKRHGLLVYISGDEGTNVPYAPVVRVAKYEAAKEVSVSNGRRSAQGQKWAQKAGFFRTAGPTPIGCDRLYCGADDQPKFVIHNLGNGLQEQRDWTSGKVIGNYGSVGTKSRNRFKKQRNEYSLLVPGDRGERKVVRVIFYLRYKKGWRGARIADYLNRHGVPSPKGKEWSQRQAQIIYENDAYTGVTYNDKTFSGRFFRRDAVMGFVALERDACDLVMKKTFAPKLRPKDEWERIDQPYMYDFLPHDLRDMAIASLAQLWKDRTDPNRSPHKPSAHPASEYLLSDRLRAVQDGGLLVGTLSGPPNNKTPYYRHRKSKRGRRKGSVFNHLIPAKPLHDAIVVLLGEVLLDVPDLKAQLTRHLNDQRAAALQDQPDVAELEAERDELRQQIQVTMQLLTGAALEDARGELKRLGDRRNAIEARLAACRSDHKQDMRPVETVIDDAIQTLAEDSHRLLTLPIEPLRGLVNRLIADATVDMETKAVELKLTLPTWALEGQRTKKISGKGQKTVFGEPETVCPATSTWSQFGGWTQSNMATARCEYVMVQGSQVPPCYRCQRTAA
jgi:hypothetical protein